MYKVLIESSNMNILMKNLYAIGYVDNKIKLYGKSNCLYMKSDNGRNIIDILRLNTIESTVYNDNFSRYKNCIHSFNITNNRSNILADINIHGYINLYRDNGDVYGECRLVIHTVSPIRYIGLIEMTKIKYKDLLDIRAKLIDIDDSILIKLRRNEVIENDDISIEIVKIG